MPAAETVLKHHVRTMLISGLLMFAIDLCQLCIVSCVLQIIRQSLMTDPNVKLTQPLNVAALDDFSRVAMPPYILPTCPLLYLNL